MLSFEQKDEIIKNQSYPATVSAAIRPYLKNHRNEKQRTCSSFNCIASKIRK
jgi:hypothetical protein